VARDSRGGGEYTFVDSLYGGVALRSEISALALTPLVQRLRDIRLSNIDSLAAPGISGISRFEHVLGTAWLAGNIGAFGRLSRNDQIALGAACLLHDAACMPFGHLAEEALNYIGSYYEHERKWAALLAGETSGETGGFGMQVFRGRLSGLRPWAISVFGAQRAATYMGTILGACSGTGPLGGYIKGGIDLDNLDNVVRLAFHLGIPVKRDLGLEIARNLVGLGNTGRPIFTESSVPLVSEWLRTRARLYQQLMLAPRDFAGKIMLLFAMVRAFESGEVGGDCWNYTDRELLGLLMGSPPNSDIRLAIDRWVLGDTWELSELMWFEGDRPPWDQIWAFTKNLPIRKSAFAYAISDKRSRQVDLQTSEGALVTLGKKPELWVLGIATPLREGFTNQEARLLAEAAEKAFGARRLDRAAVAEEPEIPLFQ
jgi:uncharacterized protein